MNHHSQTFAGRNNSSRQKADAAEPLKAIRDNVNAYRQALIKKGYTDADINKAIDQLSRPYQNSGTSH